VIAVDFSGRRFGRLRVIELHERDTRGVAHYRCLCDCGGATFVRSDNLTRGVTRSCGCLRRAAQWRSNHIPTVAVEEHW
jgi:hypothetical protein